MWPIVSDHRVVLFSLLFCSACVAYLNYLVPIRLAYVQVLCGSVTVDTSNPDLFSSCLSSGDAEAQKEPDVVLSDADLRVRNDCLTGVARRFCRQ